MSEMPVIASPDLWQTLVPLWCRAQCCVLYPYLGVGALDAEIISRLRADFSVARQSEPLLYALRQDVMLSRVRRCLDKHPEAVLVDLGCGLDTLLRRADNGRCRMIYVDTPEVMRLRAALLPPGERETYIAGDARNLSSLEGLDASGGACVVMSGLLCHLGPEENRALLRALAVLFPGCTAVFDGLGRLSRPLSGGMGIRSRLPGESGLRRWDGVESAEAVKRLPESYSALPRLKRAKLRTLLALGVLRLYDCTLA